MDAIKKYFTDFWANTKQYFKINIVALILIAAVITVILVLFLPHQKHADQILNEKYNQIAELYNSKTGQWTDPVLAMKLQSEATGLEKDRFLLNLFQLVILFGCGIVFIPIGAWIMQWLYTDIKFTRQIFTGMDQQLNDDERKNKLIVLAAALLSATIAYCVSMVIAFYR